MKLILKDFLINEFYKIWIKTIFLNAMFNNSYVFNIYKKWWFKENKINFKLKKID